MPASAGPNSVPSRPVEEENADQWPNLLPQHSQCRKRQEAARAKVKKGQETAVNNGEHLRKSHTHLWPT